MKLNKKNLKYGSIATVITVAVLAAIIVVNLICTVLVDRYNIRFDLTDEGIFTLTDTTKKFLSELTTGCDIYVTYDEIYFTQSSDKSYKQVKYLLDEYELSSNGNISVTYSSELVNDADFINRFSFISLSLGNVVVVSREQPEDGKITNYRRFALADCFTTTTYSNNTYQISKVENNLTSAIMYLNQDSSTNIAFTLGHGESELDDEAKSLITSNIYSTSSVNLAMLASLDGTQEQSAAETLAGIAVIVIYCPRSDFSLDELSLLDVFMENSEKLGKGLMVFYDPTTPHLPNLEEFLHEWGVTVGDGIVYDTTRNYMHSVTVPRVMIPTDVYGTLSVNSSPISAELYNDVSNASVNLCTPLARPLSIVKGYGTDDTSAASYGFTVYKALSSYGTSALMKTSTDGVSEDDETGMFTVGTLSRKTRIINSREISSNLFVCGSASFIDAAMLTDSIFANDRYFIEMLNYFTQRDVGVVVSAKDVTKATLNSTPAQETAIMVIFLGVLPVLALAAAVYVFIRRRTL